MNADDLKQGLREMRQTRDSDRQNASFIGDLARECIRDMPASDAKFLKRALQNFNIKTGEWKP